MYRCQIFFEKKQKKTLFYIFLNEKYFELSLLLQYQTCFSLLIENQPSIYTLCFLKKKKLVHFFFKLMMVR